MSDTPEADDENPFRPVWETDDELDPPGRLRTKKPVGSPAYDHPLLTPLARAQNALARLEAKSEMASAVIVEGLRARMSYLEAAGWLRYAYVWIHPTDLTLREQGAFNYWAAARSGQLSSALPKTIAEGADFADADPSAMMGLDLAANQALKLARSWRRLAELRTWRPLADAEAVRKSLESIGRGRLERGVIEDWLGGVYARETGPDLIRAGRAAADWRCEPGVKDKDPDGIFLAACLWHGKNRTAPIPLPFWSAPELYHQRLSGRTGLNWMEQFLGCVAEGAMVGLRELTRLGEAEKKRAHIGATPRSRLPDAVDAVLRMPAVTTDTLAKALDVTPRAALGLLQRLTAAGIVREVTGRASWQVFMLSVSN